MILTLKQPGTLRGLYNLFNGKRYSIIQATCLAPVFLITNAMQIRLIAYERFGGRFRDQFIGTLYYSSSESVLHELNLFLKKSVQRSDLGKYICLGDDLEFSDFLNPTDNLWTDTHLRLVSSNFSYDPKSFTGFSVKLKYMNVEVTIPIEYSPIQHTELIRTSMNQPGF